MYQVASERLLFRLLVQSDVTATYVSWLNDPEVGRFLETRFSTQSEKDVSDFVAAMQADSLSHLFGIFLKTDGEHIGNIKVGPVSPRHRVADVSLFIGAKACWGQGFATEAIRAISRWSFDELGLLKLSASMYAENEGSARAFDKAGYRVEGVRRRHYLLEGKSSDVLEYGLCADELEEGVPAGF